MDILLEEEVQLKKDRYITSYREKNKEHIFVLIDKDTNELKLVNKGIHLLESQFLNYVKYMVLSKITLVKRNDQYMCFCLRKEYDYHKETQTLTEYQFEDVLLINNDRLYYLFNTKVNIRFSNDILDNFLDLEKTSEDFYCEQILNIKEDFELLNITKITFDYIFHKSKILNMNENQYKNKFKTFIHSIINKKIISLEYITMTRHQLEPSISNELTKNNNCFYLQELFEETICFKELLFKTFDIPDYLKKKKSLYDIFHSYLYPGLENTWFKYPYFDLKENEITSIFLNIPKRELNKNYNLSLEKYKEITYKELKNNSILFNKRINELLKSKILFVNELNKHEYRDYKKLDDITFLLLFKNENYLLQVIEKMPNFICKQNSSYISSKPTQTINLLPLELRDLDDEYPNSIAAIQDFISKRFKTYEHFEKSFVKYTLKYFENDGLINLMLHLDDILKIFYKIETYDVTNKEKNQILFYYDKQFTSFSDFESNLMKAYNILFYDKKNVPLNQNSDLNYIETDTYYFQQPQNSLELKIIGDTMHHCVFSYLDELKKKKRKKEIIVMYEKKTKKPLVCLELNKIEKEYYCVQAKCKHNELVKKNQQYNQLVIDFLQKNNVMIKTDDVEIMSN